MILFVTILVFILIAIAILAKIYTICSMGLCSCRRDMSGKTVIITGGNRGIGKETARELAERNARVIIACRDINEANQTINELIVSTRNPQIFAKYCDLSSFSSIKSFADDIIRNESHVDVLICNAANIPFRGKHLTEDGLEKQFGINHFGHFLLTNLLMDLLVKSGASRVIVVSSLMHYFGNIDFDNINFEKYNRSPYFVYCNTKLANILFVKELAKRLNGTKVTANALHPGLVKTDINQTVWFIKNFIQPIAYLWAKNARQGSQTTVHLAVAEELENVSGKYFADCKETRSSLRSRDEKLAQKLWTLSEKLTQREFKIEI
jgi:NAD(P)-dependent dehydrogenase (short-subunit alcohol dehydrogenase family)